MRRHVPKLWLGLGILAAATLLLAPPTAARKKKKLSLAELAALEWKLEQGTNTLVNNADPKARKKALADLASIDDPRKAKPLARALKEDPLAEVRLEAAKALAAMETPEAKGLLRLASMSDPDANVRSTAEQLLKKLPRRMKEAALPLKERSFKPPRGKVTGKTIGKLLTYPSGDARLWAVRQMGKVRFRGRAKLLQKHLFADPSARVRSEAAQLLAQIYNKKALPVLIKAVGDGNPLVRFNVARAIAEFDDAGALSVVQRLATSDPNETVKAEAKDLLEPTTPVGKRLLAVRIKKLRSANPAERITALKELSEFTHWRAMVPMSCSLVNDKSPLVRSAAAEVLTDMHDTSVQIALRVAAVIEGDRKLRNKIRRQVGRLRRKVDGLIKQLRSSDVTERVLAARALGQGAYPPGLKPLQAAAKDKEARVRLAVARGLANFPGDAAKDALTMMGSDSDPRVRRVVTKYFAKKKRIAQYRRFFKDANRVVMKTRDKSPIWRTDAAVALGILGAETAVGNLAQLLLHDENEQVRLAAAWSLALMGLERGMLALKKAAAKDESTKVRLTARKYMIIHKVSLDDLVKQLRDEDAEVRQDAAEAISLRPKRRVLNELIRSSLCDPEHQVRISAMRGLARVANQLARTAIQVAQSRDPSKRVRRTAYMMYILAGGT